jgi:hypothetical protein
MQSQSNCDEFKVAQQTLDVARVIESQNVTLDHFFKDVIDLCKK